jgi:D-3-phosphoglycerate dehydrogenase
VNKRTTERHSKKIDKDGRHSRRRLAAKLCAGGETRALDRPRLLCMMDMNMVPESLTRLREVAEVDCVAPDPAILRRTIGDYDVLWTHLHAPVDADVLARAGRLKLIATATTGTDHIDIAAARQRGIEVLSIKEEYELLEGFTATAELAWTLLLMCVRNMRPMLRTGLSGSWEERESLRGRQLSNMTLGVLGFGRLGKNTARYGRAFCRRVLACDVRPFREVFQGWPAEGVVPVDFETLLRESDAISIHIHMTPENRHLFNAAVFARMKPGSVLINTSRGDIIDEGALIEALESGRLAAFGADVLHGEGRERMEDNPVIQYAQDHENVIITPHMGGGTQFSVVEARRFMADKVVVALKRLSR